MKAVHSNDGSRLRAAERRATRATDLLERLEHQQELLALQNEELQRAHEELEISHRRFAELHEQAPIGFLTFDQQGFIRQINSAAMTLLHVARTCIGKPFVIYVARDERKKFLDHLWKVPRSRDAVVTDFRVVTHGGATTHVQMTTGKHHDLSGRSSLFLSVIEDVTRVRKAGADLAYLASIVQSSQDGIISYKLDGTVQSWNFGAQKLLGYRPREIIGKNISLIVPEEQRAEFARNLEAVKKGEVVPPHETFRQRQDGLLVAVELTLSPVMDGGRVVAVTAIGRDISERQKAAREIRELNAELEQRVAARTADLQETNEALKRAIEERRRLEGEIIGISEAEQQRIAQDLHDDLGQQLAGIWCLSLAMQRNLETRAAPEAENAARIAEHLSKSLALTRSLARGLHPVTPEPGGLRAALRELARRSSELFKVRCTVNCRRNMHIPDPAMATHLYRIAQEAVTNACKHGAAKRIEIALSFTDGNVVLSVSDNGREMKKAPGRKGGLGLRIMNYRAETLGGSLVFENRPGGGKNVICTVPNDPAASTKN